MLAPARRGRPWRV
jgi:hypothetical protein